MSLPGISKHYTFLLLRAVVGVIFVTHGAARLAYGSVPDFGAYLNAQGFLVGVPLAWAITIGEIVSGSSLAIGYKVRYCVLFHALVIVTGLVLVHLPNGWFVVGHGAGGVEYSVLILATLSFIYANAEREPAGVAPGEESRADVGEPGISETVPNP